MSTENAARRPTAEKQPDACACDHHGFERELREVRARWLDETKGLRSELARQAQQHPLATFGVAFAAGLLVARALRR
ncbi:MAG TPA: hypothetical protein VFB32_14030 [Rudaea sp.]|nr:hypothetical protein [Rudaea sp.]